MARVFDSGRRPWEWTGRRFACPFRRAFCGSGLVREDGGSDDASSENAMASSRTGRHLACPFRRAFCGSGLVREDGGSDDASSENVMASSRTSPLPQGLAYNAERSAYTNTWEWTGRHLACPFRRAFCGSGLVREDGGSDDASSENVMASSRTSPLPQGFAYNVCEDGSSDGLPQGLA
ncbi:5-oxoprolinase/urea amidolyase family protein [Pseudomonas syringae]|nr:5-oxoprolinase/urea amidolyase family protein [Pseudomonas syringae]